MKKYLLPLFISFGGIASAQVDTSASTFTISGYAEVYYAYDFSNPENHNRPSFLYSHNRHNEFNLNLATYGWMLESLLPTLDLKVLFQKIALP